LNSGIAKLYEDVPDAQREQFRQYRENHPPQRVMVEGVAWEYIVAGQGDETLVLLPGALGTPDISWDLVMCLAERRRVVAPSYAPMMTMDALVDGIAGVLERVGIDRAHVVGGSYGGFVGQAFVRRHPDVTRSLVLSHTQPPDPAGAEQVKKVVRWLSLLPAGMLRWLLGRSLRKLMPEKTPETALSHAIFEEALRYRLTKADLLSRSRCAIDFSFSDYTPQDLADWPGRILLLMSDSDPSTPEPVRAAMQALYPQAEVHLFHGTGHASSLLKRDEFLAALEGFLRTLPES
jgi:pimeloyl-ACP methyl ester carboxylesterase